MYIRWDEIINTGYLEYLSGILEGPTITSICKNARERNRSGLLIIDETPVFVGISSGDDELTWDTSFLNVPVIGWATCPRP